MRLLIAILIFSMGFAQDSYPRPNPSRTPLSSDLLLPMDTYGQQWKHSLSQIFSAGLDAKLDSLDVRVATIDSLGLNLDAGGYNISDIGTATATTFTDATFSVSSGAFTGVASITDGTASWSSSNLSGFGSISGTTLTDGTASTTGGIATGYKSVSTDSAKTDYIVAKDSSNIDIASDIDITATNELNLSGGGDTYLTESSADVLDVYVGGANMLKMTEDTADTLAVTADVSSFSGNVGIGTTTPGTNLHINDGSVGDQEVLRLSQLGNTGSRDIVGMELNFNNGATSGGRVQAIKLDDSGSALAFSVGAPSNGAFAEKVRITSTGNVGIGTTAPDKALEINHATGANLRLTYNDADGSATNYADFETTSGGNLTITPSGGDADVNGDLTASTVAPDTYIIHGTTAGISAVNPGGQGDGALTTTVNEVSTVTTTDDAVTLPTAQAGLEIFIINNGANQLEIWPASGDDAGGGVDTAITLASGSNLHLVAYDATNWESF